jgi:hypothetical protein
MKDAGFEGANAVDSLLGGLQPKAEPKPPSA